MKKNLIIAMCAVVCLPALGLVGTAAQFPVKLPNFKIEKPKTEPPKTDSSRPADVPAITSPASTGPKSSGVQSTRIYGPVKPDDRQLLIKDSIYIQADTHKDYWKMPGQKYSSWVPRVKLNVFFRGYTVPYVAEYFKPDGSLWFTEPLEQGWPGDIFTVPFESNRSNTNKVRETISTVATGVYGIKVTNANTKEIVFHGKFKVGKFLPPYRSTNEFEFYVDHDWVMPIGFISYHESNFRGAGYGGFTMSVSMWFKKAMPDREHGLEARILYKNQTIATTADGGGHFVSGFRRASDAANMSAELYHWQLWDFRWKRVIVDNGGGYNPDNHPNAFLLDKNPGEYTIKVYHKGVQVREAKFTVGSDGRIVDGGYARPDYLTYHKVIIPVAVIGPAEKYNAAAWKTEAFYGNPMIGFAAP